MKTRLPTQALSTKDALTSVLPPSFKMVKDTSSNGYKYFNLLFGIELDYAKLYIKEIYNNSFLPTMDMSLTRDLYQVNLSGLSNGQYLNTTNSGIPIKIVNNGSPGGETEFWDGDPTRVYLVGTYDLGLTVSGNITGAQYLRINNSGYGYFLISTDLDHSGFMDPGLSGAVWKIDVDDLGNLLNTSGLWPGVATQNFDTQGLDDVLTPLGSGFLSQTYPLQIQVLNSGAYYWIDAYEPSHGWITDAYGKPVAVIDYSGEYYYTVYGKKLYYRSAFNNPYGSGNFTTEYLNLKNIPISGTLKIYDMDILDVSGNAIEIPATGINLYWFQGDDPASGVTYIGYSSTVPNESKYGNIAGLGANLLTTTSWSHQYGSGYISEGSKSWVEGSGTITNQIKMINPHSRYIAEYKFKTYNKTNYITSLDGSRYVAFDTNNPIYSINNVLNNAESIPYEFTRDPVIRGPNNDQGSRYLTFDGYLIRPNSQMSRVDFDIPLLLESGYISFRSFQQRYNYVGYSPEFVPIYSSKKIVVVDCPFSTPVIANVCIESDLSGSGNQLEWHDTGTGNQLYLSAVNGVYGKTERHVNGNSYYRVEGISFLKNNTFFRWDFRLFTPNDIVLMDLHDSVQKEYITVKILSTGQLMITSNGKQVQSRYYFLFDDKPKSIIMQTWLDITSGVPSFNIYVKDSTQFVKQVSFESDLPVVTISDNYLHVFQNSTLDIQHFKLWYEDSIWPV